MDFKPAEREKVETSEDPGHVFIHSLKEKGIISLTDVSVLAEKLQFCGLHGVADDVQESFKRYQSKKIPHESKSHKYEGMVHSKLNEVKRATKRNLSMFDFDFTVNSKL